MKNRSVSLCLLTATLFASPIFAADKPAETPPPPPVPGPGMHGGREAMMKRFDTDGDGQLNDAERQARREEMKKQWAGREGAEGFRGPGGPEGPRGEMRGKMMKRFDRDGDGKFSPGERHHAKKAFRKMQKKMHHRMHHRKYHHRSAGHGLRGPHGMGPGHGPGAAMPGQMMQRFDQDKDGRLSETERAEAKKAGEALRTRMQADRKEMLARFDADGDGKLSESERTPAREAWQTFLQAQPTLKPAAK